MSGVTSNNGHAFSGGSRLAEKLTLKSPRQRNLVSIAVTAERPVSTTELTEIVGQTLGATAHHVRALVTLGALDWAGERRNRGAVQTFYVVSDAGREALREATIGTVIDLFGVVRLPAGKIAYPQFDEEGRGELAELIDDFRARYSEIAERAMIRSRTEGTAA